MHWCIEETMALLSMLSFIGIFFRRLQFWFQMKFGCKCHKKISYESYDTPNFKKLQQLTHYPNWDLEGGKVVSETLWQVAEQFYSSLRDSCLTGWVEPHVSPSGDGTVHFTWIRGGKRLNLELDAGLWYFSARYSLVSDYKKCTISPEEAVTKVLDFLN